MGVRPAGAPLELLADAPDAPDVTYDDQGLTLAEQVPVVARWAAPDGSERIGDVLLIAAHHALRWRLDRRRLAGWDDQ